MHENFGPATTINLQLSGSKASIVLVGDLDLEVEKRIVRHMEMVFESDRLEEVHVDTTAVTFIDSSGLRALLISGQLAAERGLTYSLGVAAGGPVARLLELAGLHRILSDQLCFQASATPSAGALVAEG